MNPSDLKIGYIVKMYPRLSETFILNEILELERRGVEIAIFSARRPNEGRFHPQVSNVKASVFYLDELEPKKWPSWLGDVWPVLSSHRARFWPLVENALVARESGLLDLLLSSAWLGAKAEEMGLSHLHAHFGSLSSTYPYFAHLITGIPFSFTAHARDIYFYDMQQHYLRDKLFAAKFVVTVTDYNRRYLMEENPGLNDDKINVIYNGIDASQFKCDGRQIRDSNHILGVGRLVPKKGFNNLLDACRLLKDRNVSFRCSIVGDGQEAELLRQQTRDLDLDDQVSFLGARNQQEIMELMQQATLLCLPCTVDVTGDRDALPTVILEAMACGLPVISTDISGIPEIIDSGIDGSLVKPDDPLDLSQEIEDLLSSDDKRARFVREGLKKVRSRFDLSTNVDSLLKLFLGSSIEIPSSVPAAGSESD